MRLASGTHAFSGKKSGIESLPFSPALLWSNHETQFSSHPCGFLPGSRVARKPLVCPTASRRPGRPRKPGGATARPRSGACARRTGADRTARPRPGAWPGRTAADRTAGTWWIGKTVGARWLGTAAGKAVGTGWVGQTVRPRRTVDNHPGPRWAWNHHSPRAPIRSRPGS